MLHSAIEGFHVDDAFCDVEPEEDEAVKPSRGSRSLFLLRLGYKQGSIHSVDHHRTFRFPVDNAFCHLGQAEDRAIAGIETIRFLIVGVGVINGVQFG